MVGSEQYTRWGAILVLALVLLMVAQTFQYFPLIGPSQEAWNGFCLFYFVFFYLPSKALGGWSFSQFELYLLALMLAIPVLSALCAMVEFRQPLLYGLLAQRALIDIAAVLGIENAIRERRVTLSEIKKALLLLAWGTWFLNVAIRVVLDPSSFHDTPFVSGAGDTASFALQGYFIIFGALFYAFQGVRSGINRNYVLAIILLAGSIGKTGSRTVVLAALMTFFFFMCRWVRLDRLLVLLPLITLSMAVFLGALYLVAPERVAERLSKFQQAVTVTLTGEQVEDVSANARTTEVPYAIMGVLKHPIVGNGNLSNQWQGGRKGVQGTYFYPADVGILGILYLYGTIGLLAYAAQYWFAFLDVRGLSRDAYTPLMDAIKGTLLYFALISLASGTIAFDAGLTLVFIVFLGAAARRIRSIDQEIASGLIKAQPARRILQTRGYTSGRW